MTEVFLLRFKKDADSGYFWVSDINPNKHSISTNIKFVEDNYDFRLRHYSSVADVCRSLAAISKIENSWIKDIGKFSIWFTPEHKVKGLKKIINLDSNIISLYSELDNNFGAGFISFNLPKLKGYIGMDESCIFINSEKEKNIFDICDNYGIIYKNTSDENIILLNEENYDFLCLASDREKYKHKRDFIKTYSQCIEIASTHLNYEDLQLDCPYDIIMVDVKGAPILYVTRNKEDCVVNK